MGAISSAKVVIRKETRIQITNLLILISILKEFLHYGLEKAVYDFLCPENHW